VFDKIIRALTALSVVVIGTAIITACGTAAITPAAAPATSVDTAAIDAYVAKMLETYAVPGAAIALVLPDGSTYTRGYGVRDTGAGKPVTADTQFAIASVTKSFTALGVMLLVDEGTVDLDAPVTTYLPEFRLSDPAMTPRVTVRHLLMHASGMERNNAATGNPTITRDQVVALAAETPLVAAPGEKYVYSNVNTVVAGRIIEVVSGQSWEEFTRERILTPLGMTSATLSTTAMQQQPDFALPHELDLIAGMVPGTPFEPYAEAPAGGINASANEMLRYLQLQLGDGRIESKALLPPESLAELHRTQIATDETSQGSGAARRAAEQGVPAPETLISDFGYGLYWYTERFQGHRVVEHDGQAPGYSASMSFAPDEGVGVVVLTNAAYAFGFVESVRLHVLEELLNVAPRHDTQAIIEAQLALEGRDLASVRAPIEAVRSYTADPAQLEALSGTYTNLAAPEPAMVTVVDGRALRLELESPTGPLSLDLLPVAADRFLINTPPYRGFPVEFKADAEGTLVTLNGFEIARRPAQP
jgi:CubicO group peptidase (beta-lactamase class C family)